MTKGEYAFEYSKAVYREVLERTSDPSEALFHELVAYREAQEIWENSEGEEEEEEDVEDKTG